MQRAVPKKPPMMAAGIMYKSGCSSYPTKLVLNHIVDTFIICENIMIKRELFTAFFISNPKTSVNNAMLIGPPPMPINVARAPSTTPTPIYANMFLTQWILMNFWQRQKTSNVKFNMI